MKRLLIGALLAITLVPAAARAQDTEESRRAAYEARRDSLEAEVVRKFVRHLSDDLSLSDEQQEQTIAVLRQSGLERRALSLASSQLRDRLRHAARDSATADAEFIRLLAEYETLRTREHDLWRRDQNQLAVFLNPRQRTQFLLAWARFQDDMREIIWRRLRDDDDRDRRDDDDRRRGNGGDEHDHGNDHSTRSERN